MRKLSVGIGSILLLLLLIGGLVLGLVLEFSDLLGEPLPEQGWIGYLLAALGWGLLELGGEAVGAALEWLGGRRRG